MSATLVIEDLRGGIPGREIVQGLSLRVPAGEVHAVMGPNGSGKSTLANLLLGRPGYEVTGGRVAIEDGTGTTELLGLPTWQRAQAGLFLGMQSPIEVPGVAVVDVLAASVRAGGGDAESVPARLAAEAARIGFDSRFLTRALNVDLSGGEKKRNETVQLGVLEPKFAVLDEIDSGLDVDALRAVARRVIEQVREKGLGVLVITHFSRLLEELPPDRIHILRYGRLVADGGPELAAELEVHGYAKYDDPELEPKPAKKAAADPFADPFA